MQGLKEKIFLKKNFSLWRNPAPLINREKFEADN
jgi:hypothetical protein